LLALGAHRAERLALQASSLLPQLFLLSIQIQLLVEPIETAHRSHSLGARSAGRLRPDRACDEQAGCERHELHSVTCTHLSLLLAATRRFSRAIVSRLFPPEGKSLQIVSHAS